MRLKNSLLFGLVSHTFAARYAIDETCGSANDAMFKGVKGAVQEAIELAGIAFSVMTDNPSDPWVQKMAKFILGTDDYDNKFVRARATFAAVAGYDKEPSPSPPRSEAWRSTRSNLDVEIYCGASRFVQLPGTERWSDMSMRVNIRDGTKKQIDLCYKTDFVMGSGVSAPKALTISSDNYDATGYIRRTDLTMTRQNFITPRPNVACTMDICTWFIAEAARNGWPTIYSGRVDKCKTDDFKAGLFPGLTPIDGLKTMGSTMLHELTHTNQGGRLVDIHSSDLPPGTSSCYNWLCIGTLMTERNADSIAMLGVAMKLWSLRHYAENDGTIHSIPRPSTG